MCCARSPCRSQQLHHAIELVEDLLEPELVDLVDHDEEQLVVLVGSRLLQLEQLSTLR